MRARHRIIVSGFFGTLLLSLAIPAFAQPTTISLVTATSSPPTYVEGSSSNPLSTNLTGDLRTIAKQSGTWNVGTVTNPVGIKGADGSAIASNANPLPISDAGGTITVDGTVTVTGVSTAALQGAQGTGSTYNPPTGGSGEIGYLSGIYAAAVDTTPAVVNQTQINGVTLLAGNGATGTGSQRVTIANDNSPVPVSQGACTPVGYQSAASNNQTNNKASAGTWCGGLAINTTATIYYLRLYNLAAAPTCSSATGFVTTIPIPASASGSGTELDLAGGMGAAFSAGIGWCLTGGGSSTDNSNAATGVYLTVATK